MRICVALVNIVKVIVRTVIKIVREVLRTVCSWVTTTIRTVREVVEKVCKWLPWPLNKLCKWVTKLIEVIETVTEWVCKEVIDRIVEWVENIVEYVFYIINWICWVIEWIPRFFLDLIWCWLGIKPKKFIRICVKILTDENDNPAVSGDEVRRLLREAQNRFDQCNIELVIIRFEFIKKPEFLSGFSCGFKGLFSAYHLWFNEQECSQPLGSFLVPITIFVVNDIKSTKGCAIPGTNYIVIDKDASDATIPHEIGHLSSLFAHSDDPENVMFSPSSDKSTKFTKNQCCMIRSSRYATLTGKIGFLRLTRTKRIKK